MIFFSSYGNVFTHPLALSRLVMIVEAFRRRLVPNNGENGSK